MKNAGRPVSFAFLLFASSQLCASYAGSVYDNWQPPTTSHYIGFGGAQSLSVGGDTLLTATIFPTVDVDLDLYRFRWAFGVDDTWLEYTTSENSTIFSWEDWVDGGFSTVVGTSIHFSAEAIPEDGATPLFFFYGVIETLTLVPEPAEASLLLGLVGMALVIFRRSRSFSA